MYKKAVVVLAKYSIVFLNATLLVGIAFSLCWTWPVQEASAAERAPLPLETAGSTASAQVGASDTLPPGLASAIARVLSNDLPEAYHFTASPGGYQANNPAHDFQFEFTPAGLQVSSAAGAWTWGWNLTVLHYAGVAQPVPPSEPVAAGARLEYQRGPILTEWYLNGLWGLEQGFTLTRPPRSSNPCGVSERAIATTEDAPLRLELTLSGSLHIQMQEDVLLLTAPSGQVVARYGGLHAYDADGQTLPARLETSADRLSILVDDRAARYPITIDPWLQSAKLTAWDGGGFDCLGKSVDVDGDTVVVGAPDADINHSGDGGAYVFVRPALGWTDTSTYTARLTYYGGNFNHHLGKGVAVSGDTVVVGAYGEGWPPHMGATYVYVKPVLGWTSTSTPTAVLTASDRQEQDRFGYAVDIDGDTIVVGAPGDDLTPPPNYDQGSAYVFVRPGGGWASGTETAKLTAGDHGPNEAFGWAVAIGGDTVVVGSPYHYVGGTMQGAVYLFSKPGGGWTNMTQTAQLTASDGVEGDNFGLTVAINADEDTVAAGAPYDSIAYQEQGSAYVFVEPGGGWANMTQTAKLTAGGGGFLHHFGRSVSISADRVVAGAPSTASNTGSVYVFDEPVTGWADSSSYTQKLNASDASGATEFGFAVAIDADGDTMVIGAPFADVIHQDQGAAYVFERVPSIVIDDVVVTEGHSGATDAVFTITRSEPLGENSVQYQTQDGTATTADGDYAAISGTVSFTGGEITRTITVTVCGDTMHEPDETFFVNLSDATHAVISDTQGVGTILNDDNAPPDDLTFSLAPNPLAEGSEITVTGSFTDLDNITHTVTIAWGDTTPDTTLPLSNTFTFSGTHSYADDGFYTVGVTVQDPPGASAHCTDTVTVTNVTPTLTLGGEASVDEGSVYMLTLSAVTDPGDDTVSVCSLDWGDGSPTQDCLSHVGGTMQYTYADGDEVYTVTVELTDEDGTYTDIGAHTVTVTNVTPTLTLSGEASVGEGSVYTLTLSAVTDPGDDTVSACSLDWGDGSLTQDCLAHVGGTMQYTYADGDKVYTVTINLTDEDGTYTDVDTHPVTVTNVTPTLTLGGEASVDEGSVYTLTLSAVTDPGDDTVSVCSLDWGDGSPTQDCLGHIGDTMQYTYADGDEVYTVTVDLTDEDGTYTSVDAHPVTVNNVAPALGPLADRSVTVGDVVTVTGIFTDAGTFDTYSVVIQWAQDVSEMLGLAAGVREFCAGHTYTVSAEYTVTVTITDDDGGQDSDSFTVIVEPHYIYLPLVQRQAQGGTTIAGGGADEFARRTPVPSSTSGRLRPGAAARWSHSSGDSRIAPGRTQHWVSGQMESARTEGISGHVSPNA